MPIPPGKGFLLAIGCGWGRWLAAAATKGSTPVGVDIKLEAAPAAREVLHDLALPGYVVVADLEYLPFADEVFDSVWSFSVLQHAHRRKVAGCFFFSSRRRHTSSLRDWSSDVCSSDLAIFRACSKRSSEYLQAAGDIPNFALNTREKWP